MAFICFFLTFASVAGADFSAQGSYAPIRAADFDVIAANMRRGPDLSRNLPAACRRHTASIHGGKKPNWQWP
jgi:hypothetical protein